MNPVLSARTQSDSDEALFARPEAGAALKDPSDTDRAPLSFAQQRLWFIEQLQPGSALYNLPDVWRLTGHLNPEIFARSVNEVVRRHGSLRTVFHADDSGAAQTVQPFQPVSVPVTDLSAGADPQLEARRCVEEEIRNPFMLETGPLFRARLLKAADADWYAVFNAHHIVWDGWSIELFRREVAACYEACVSGTFPDLPPAAGTYVDFARWQRKASKGAEWEEQLAYWTRQLRDAPPLELPSDRPRPVTPVFAGSTRFSSIDRDLAESLRALSRRHGVTMFMTLLAAFKVLLHRYTRQEDVLVGSPIAGRGRPEAGGVIGFFVNTLVLRTDLGGDPTFAELLTRVRRTTVEAYAHEEMPFERIVQELQPERSLSRNPLFQVMFGYERIEAGEWGLSDIRARAVEVDSGTSKFDWTLLLQETGAGIQAAFEYSTEMFDAKTIERVLGHFRTLLEAIVANPEERISRLQLLNRDEAEQVIVHFNRTRADYDRAACVHQLFEARAKLSPSAAALVDESGELTYAELDQRANGLARRLIELGAGPDARVGLCTARSRSFAIAVLAVLKAGAAYVPLDSACPPERLQRMISIASPLLVLADRSADAALPDDVRVVRLEDAMEVADASVPGPGSAVEPGHLAYVIFTSGSTGEPKGVAMPHGSLVNLLEWQLRHFAFRPAARTLQFASAGFDVSFQEMFSTWCAGGTLIFVPEDLRRDPAELWSFIGHQKAERLFVPFVALQQLAEAAAGMARLPDSLREIITAGEALRVTPQLVELFRRLPQCSLCNQYGPSETHVVTFYPLPSDPETWPALPPIGRPVHNTAVYLLDGNLQPVPVGVPGELYIGGDSLARGYLNRPDLTRERFLPVPADWSSRVPRGRMYRTGDLARWREDGMLEFLGRADFQVKIRGFRVEPGEVETVLQRHPSVESVVVTPHDRKDGSRELVAYVVTRTGCGDGFVMESEWRRFMGEQLPEYMIPSLFVRLDSLPLTPSGKVNRLALPAPEPAQRLGGRTAVPPRNSAERAIAEIWSEVLERNGIGIHDNFFQLGGHSLIATRLVSRIGRAFQVDLPVRVIFESPTIAGLAERVASLPRRGEAVPEDRIGRRLQPGEAMRLLQRLDELSEAEIEMLLRTTEVRSAAP